MAGKAQTTCSNAPVQELLGEDEYGTYRIDDRVWTMNEIRDHPLFMEDVPSDISENPHLLALQNVLYDDQTPEELAEHFRKLGNEAFRTSTNKIASQNALMAYTRGIEMECDDAALNSHLHSNRAAVSLRLNEHEKAVDDCRKAVGLDPTNFKAYFRAAKASEALGLTKQALQFCASALTRSPEEAEFLQLRARLSERLAREESARSDARCADAKAAEALGEADKAVEALLALRGARLGPLLFEMAMYARGGRPRPKLAEDGAAVQWPLLLLYDEVSQSDFVECFDERCSLGEQLQLMFPSDRRVEWDEECKYIWDRLVAYLQFYPEGQRDTQLLHVNTEAPLVEGLQQRCLPACLVIHVLALESGAHESFCKAHSIVWSWHG
mmetsp:Transcript_95224/g.221023  ORF Transcript_95224/g.221023 Transcript_95224/m.221023 type:complete len:383 (+) Transcript_95224:46-1194(+)